MKLLKKCINAGCSINQRLDPLNGTTALHCAVRADKNASQVTKVLLDAGELRTKRQFTLWLSQRNTASANFAIGFRPSPPSLQKSF